MGKALYRKYRSKSLSEIVGQDHITKALGNALEQGRIGHAYLFTGPHGVGKTSIARILAHAVNDLPYDEASTHLDIIEIDAASNRRIEEIRDLREKVNVAPTSAKYKVYIIDEVHMLTREAFNALLKTLEEPPAHVIFILATTEAHKLPETIVSRTQRYTFKPIELSAIVKHLKDIAKQEKIDVTDTALELIAEHGGGSFRDSISLLDQASNIGTKIDVADVERLLGIAPRQAVQELHDALVNGTASRLLDNLNRLHEQGFQAASIAKQLAAVLREDILRAKPVLSPQTTLRLLGDLLSVPSAYEPRSFLELILLDYVLGKQVIELTEQAPEPIAEPTPKPAKTKKAEAAQPPAKEVEAEKPPEPPTEPLLTLKHKIKKIDGPFAEAWPTILASVKEQHNTVYSVARMAEPVLEGNKLTLKFVFPFHQKRLAEAKNKQLLVSVVEHVTGQKITLECEVDKSAQPPFADAPTPPLPDSGAINNISNIFGGAELLD